MSCFFFSTSKHFSALTLIRFPMGCYGNIAAVSILWSKSTRHTRLVPVITGIPHFRILFSFFQNCRVLYEPCLPYLLQYVLLCALCVLCARTSYSYFSLSPPFVVKHRGPSGIYDSLAFCFISSKFFPCIVASYILFTPILVFLFPFPLISL